MNSGIRRLVAVLCISAGAGAVYAAPASAAPVTIGQLMPPGTASTCVNGPFDILQTVSAGTSYQVPTGLNAPQVTEFAQQAGPNAGQTQEFKVFRKIAEPKTYLVVGSSGPRSLSATTINRFKVQIPVQAGDVIGVNDLNATVAVPNACLFNTSNADIHLERAGNLAVGASGAFGADNLGERVNVQAVVSSLELGGAATLNKKKGTATQPVNVPGPGTLALSGNGLKATTASAGKSVAAAGAASLLVKATGKKKRKLFSKGKAGVSYTITFTPSTPGAQKGTLSSSVKLKKKLK